jgi:membrane associated rhomboid family serine protease
MLEDRSYMQDTVYGPKKSITVTMLVILGVCFVLQSLLFSYSRGGSAFLEELFLDRDALARGHVWQFLTFQFLHGGFIHVLFNGVGLYFCGKALEGTISTSHWLKLYFGAGFAGGILHVLGSLILPYNFPTPVVGASAGVSGLLAAFAFLYPMQDISLYFVLRFRAHILFYILLILSIFFILVPAAGRGLGAHGAHLGGLLFGYAYVRWLMHMEWKWKLPKVTNVFRKPKVFVHTRQANQWPSQPINKADLPSEEFISKEVDPILDKISAHGIQSLTDRERKILEAARAKMAKR